MLIITKVQLYNLGKGQEAIDEFYKAIVLDQNNALANNNRAIALQKLKESKRFFK